MNMQILENHVTRPFTNEAINNKSVNQSYWNIRQCPHRGSMLGEIKQIYNEKSF